MAAVVIIEDDQRIRELMARVLAEKGYEVEGAGTALDGLQRIVQTSSRCRHSRHGPPDLDGAELLKMIRAVTDVPVVVATARSEDRDVIRTLDAGADDYLVKPFSVEQLEARVRAVLTCVERNARRRQVVVVCARSRRTMCDARREPITAEPEGVRPAVVSRRARGHRGVEAASDG